MISFLTDTEKRQLKRQIRSLENTQKNLRRKFLDIDIVKQRLSAKLEEATA